MQTWGAKEAWKHPPPRPLDPALPEAQTTSRRLSRTEQAGQAEEPLSAEASWRFEVHPGPKCRKPSRPLDGSGVRVPHRSAVRVAPAGTASPKTSSGRGLGREADPPPTTLSLCPQLHGSGPAGLGAGRPTSSLKASRDSFQWEE